MVLQKIKLKSNSVLLIDATSLKKIANALKNRTSNCSKNSKTK